MRKKVMIASVILFMITLLMCLGVTESFDQMLYTAMEGNAFKTLFRGISFFASSKGLIMLTCLLIFLLPSNKERKYLLFDLVISACVIMITKNIFARNRPLIGQVLLPGSYSYPSGHSFASITYFGFLFYLLFRSNLSSAVKLCGETFLFLLMILIPVSRLVLGVHYFSDVIAGIISGYICLQGMIYVYEQEKINKEKPLFSTFSYAINGIVTTIREERNMMIHFLMMILVVVAGIIFQISCMEWLICLILIGLILSLELVNTAIENVVDLVTKDQNDIAKKAKDIAAGAVLMMSLFAALVGLIIFIPKI